VSAVITALIPSGTGIIALANADGKQPALTNITYLIAQKLFNLDEPERQVRTRKEGEGARAMTHSLSLPRVDLAGTYHDAGYGTFELCSSSSSSINTSNPSATSSSGCPRVLDTFRLTYKPSELTEDSEDEQPRLYASWPSVFTTHAIFIPARPPPTGTDLDTAGRYSIYHFVVYFGALYPAGYGRDTTPFAHWTTLRPPRTSWLRMEK
jgi:hypothetical protein